MNKCMKCGKAIHLRCPTCDTAMTTAPTLSDVELAGRAFDMLEGAADKWAEVIDLNGMTENIVSPMQLNPDAPSDVRESFAKRMKEQIHAVVCMAWVEGAYKARCNTIDEYKQNVATIAQLKAEKASLEKQTAPPNERAIIVGLQIKAERDNLRAENKKLRVIVKICNEDEADLANYLGVPVDEIQWGLEHLKQRADSLQAQLASVVEALKECDITASDTSFFPAWQKLQSTLASLPTTAETLKSTSITR